MDVNSSSAFADALDNASEEAVSEFEATEEETVEDAESLSPEEPAEPQQESEDGEDELLADEPEGEDVEEELEATPVKWNGNPDELPDDLRETYKHMQAGFTKKMQDVAERDRQRDELHRAALANLEAQQKAQADKVSPRPTEPTAEMEVTAQNQRWAEINKWDTEQVIRDMVERGALPDPDRVNKQLAEQEQLNAVSQRMSLLQRQDGWSDEIEQAMFDATQTNQFWAQQVQTDDGALELFKQVKMQKDAAEYKSEAAKLETNKIKRTAKSAKRATQKTSTQTKSVESSPAENFANMGFDEKLDAIIKPAFGI
jgi:hypothetical protein